jgi:RHS repeat-associated protein
VNASFRYKAYGAIAQSSGASTPSSLGYAGQLLDPSGLCYMRARWYDAATARFVTRDPVLPDGSSSGQSAFSYANARPTYFRDPTGLCVPWCLGAAIGAGAYVLGLAATNLATGKSLEHAFDGFSKEDLVISTVAGALTGGLSPIVAVMGGRTAVVALNLYVGMSASVVSAEAHQRATGERPSAESILVETAIAGVGGLVPDTGRGVVGGTRALAEAGVLQTAQNTLEEWLMDRTADSQGVPSGGSGGSFLR